MSDKYIHLSEKASKTARAKNRAWEPGGAGRGVPQALGSITKPNGGYVKVRRITGFSGLPPDGLPTRAVPA